MRIFIFAVILSSFILGGCSHTIQLSTTTNDLVSFGTETNNKDLVSWEFTSELPREEKIKPYNKDYESIRSSHMGYNLDESYNLQRMTKEFMSNKFMNLSDNAPIKIKLELKSFDIEEFNPDSGGMQFLKALGEVKQRVVTGAKLKVLVTINKEGEEPQTKLITATSQDEAKGGSVVEAHAETINSVNNKFLMLLNKSLESYNL